VFPRDAFDIVVTVDDVLSRSIKPHGLHMYFIPYSGGIMRLGHLVCDIDFSPLVSIRLPSTTFKCQGALKSN